MIRILDVTSMTECHRYRIWKAARRAEWTHLMLAEAHRTSHDCWGTSRVSQHLPRLAGWLLTAPGPTSSTFRATSQGRLRSRSQHRRGFPRTVDRGRRQRGHDRHSGAQRSHNPERDTTPQANPDRGPCEATVIRKPDIALGSQAHRTTSRDTVQEQTPADRRDTEISGRARQPFHIQSTQV